MSIPDTERVQLENEMIFRKANENIIDGLDALDAQHIAEGNNELARPYDFYIAFLCECSDESCTLRIKMRLSKYRDIHSDRSQYILKRRHQLKTIEEIVQRTARYNVVKKHNTVKKNGDKLNKTTARSRSVLPKLLSNRIQTLLKNLEYRIDCLASPIYRAYDFIIKTV